MINYILLAALVAISVGDVITTKAGWKRGDIELNPVMKYIQKVLPSGWQYVRVIGAAIVGLVLMQLGYPVGILGLSVLNIIYLFVVLSNLQQ